MDDVAKFKSWANRIGFPINDLPNDDKLKSVFKSPQGLLFHNIMEKVRPKQEVQEIRRNILISKIKQFEKDKIIPKQMMGHLPKEFQRYLKIQELLKRKEEAERKLKESKKAYDTNLHCLKTKNLIKIQMENEVDELKAKENLLKLKQQTLEEKIKKENEENKKILSIIPVKITKGTENDAVIAMQKCIEELEKFYSVFFSTSNSKLRREAQDELWMKMKRIIINVPNFNLWIAVLKAKENQLQKIIALNKTVQGDETESKNKESVFSTIELNMMKTKANLISVYKKCLDIKEQFEKIEASFTPACLNFAESLKRKIKLFNTESEEEIDGIISNYVEQFVLRISSETRLEFTTQQIERYREKIASQKQILKDHHMMQTAVLETDSEIQKIIKQIQNETFQTIQIKDKIIYSKNISNYIFQNLQSARNMPASRNNLTPSSPTSFDFANSLLCSTKIDLENSVFMNSAINGSPPRLETSMMPYGGQANTVPKHVDELKIFLEIPTIKLRFPFLVSFLNLHHNSIITDGIDSVTTIESLPGHLCTAIGSLKEVEIVLKELKEIQRHAVELAPDLALVDADEAKFRAQKIAQHEEISELLDKIKVMGIKTKRAVEKTEKYFKFILENPLGNFIPSSKLFNNRSFSEYENEFNMYYRIVKNGSCMMEPK